MRKIIHIDMDCFYAAIEMRENPTLINKPIAVGGENGRRGVLCTCNYEARKYGVRSAMPSFIAKQKCPDLIILPVQFDKYRQESKAIREIFSRYTDMIEPLSLDEAYLDLTDSLQLSGSATWIAEAIRHDIYQERNLTASAGIGPNKLIAKIASDENKPNGMCVVKPDQVQAFIESLPVKKLFGVGPKLQEKLAEKGIHDCGQLQSLPLKELIENHGKMGVCLYQFSRGVDDRSVVSTRLRKSISSEWTFANNVSSTNLEQACQLLFKRLSKRWQLASQPSFTKLFVKVKFVDFKQHTHEQIYSKLDEEIFRLMVEKIYQDHHKPVRLLGFGMRLKHAASVGQLEFDYGD